MFLGEIFDFLCMMIHSIIHKNKIFQIFIHILLHVAD